LKVFLSRRARRVLDDSDPDTRVRLESKISELLTTPYPKGCKKLKGARNSYGPRIGDLRILYTLLNRMR